MMAGLVVAPAWSPYESRIACVAEVLTIRTLLGTRLC